LYYLDRQQDLTIKIDDASTLLTPEVPGTMDFIMGGGIWLYALKESSKQNRVFLWELH